MISYIYLSPLSTYVFNTAINETALSVLCPLILGDCHVDAVGGVVQARTVQISLRLILKKILFEYEPFYCT